MESPSHEGESLKNRISFLLLAASSLARSEPFTMAQSLPSYRRLKIPTRFTILPSSVRNSGVSIFAVGAHTLVLRARTTKEPSEYQIWNRWGKRAASILRSLSLSLAA